MNESEGISLLKQKKAQKTNKNRSRAQSRASGTSTAFWPNGVVYYQIDNSLCMGRRMLFIGGQSGWPSVLIAGQRVSRHRECDA
ncbi:unnamed protein product [Medioppia subpectinata]|uniref:Uncharacterized protein n=1 Tax=Medioppia subpectinata TaxID=1979941 RepID=A0A7R9QH98_9ACAR|nr:unnamed protein product [Medioppia subpectinata]CAG2120278.1 unnamed protein product [Medioppia subpectinata]